MQPRFLIEVLTREAQVEFEVAAVAVGVFVGQ